MSRTPTPIPSRTASELRRAFLDFFVARQHVEVPSSPLVPNDPTLLFNTAGMVQFKPYYTAGDDVPYTRAVTVQKCIRLTDLENVGRTPRHATFFEMLGNFSFGPKAKGAYFKEEAIAWAWEFVTKELQLPQERLYASIFEGEGNLPRDDEAVGLWKKMGVPESRIVALGRKDNFWGPAGGQGACGPCSEIYFDLGEKRPAYLAEGAFWGEAPGDPGDRYMEFWNLVFPQFDAQSDGTLTLLPRPGIDTGMGLERLALILQGRTSIFETDSYEPLVQAVLRHRHAKTQPSAIETRDARVVADHMRGVTIAIAEGVLPGNEGAGYVLRRLLRRSVTRLRSQRGLAIHEPVLADVAREVIERFGDHYTELRTNKNVLDVVEREEANFGDTYEAGHTRLEQALSRGGTTLSGADAFMLHDTYGFPIELTEEIAQERGITVDREGFERAMEEQRERARSASKFDKGADGTGRAPWTEVTSGAHSEFLGYRTLSAADVTLRRCRDHEGQLELVLDRTPCYAESGGQVADRGRITAEGVAAALTHVYKEGDAIVHRVKLVDGSRDALIAAGAKGRLLASVDPAHRLPTQRHHTATHLLHAALRHTLGTHVRQAGSLVAPDRLRFDYTHFEAATDQQLARIETLVGEWLLRNREVTWQIMPIDQAKALGAMALFGEKYGSEVRMVTVEGAEEADIPDSRELCGGTHVERTGDIGAFVLVSDAAIASGVRRIEALCGHEALRWLRDRSALLERIAASLQTSPEKLPEQIERLRGEVDKLKKAQAEQVRSGLESELLKLRGEASFISGAHVLVKDIGEWADATSLRDGVDAVLRPALGTGVAVLAVRNGGKITFVAAVTDDLVAAKTLNASDLVKKVAQVTGGSGGGKPHLALAGGKDAAKLGEALAEARRLIGEALGG